MVWLWCVLLIVAAAHSAEGSRNLLDAPKPTVTQLLPGVARAQTDEQLDQLYSDNLEQDLRPHHKLLQSRAESGHPASHYYTTLDLHEMVKAMRRRPRSNLMSLAVVHNNTLHVAALQMGDQPDFATARARSIRGPFKAAVKQGVSFPNGVFFLNLWDKPRCHASLTEYHCSGPVLSYCTTWDQVTNTSQHMDIVMPVFHHKWEDMVDYPWELKTEKALMRAALKVGMDANCSRLWLLQLARTPAGQQLLDVGVTANPQSNVFRIKLDPFLSLQDHARWKYLLATDGVSASSRLGKLLGMNSVVVKEQSPWVEHYYRSLREGQHYVSFNVQNVLQVVHNLTHADDLHLKRMAHSARAFQQKYLSKASKAVYLARVMEEYVNLFEPGSMQAFVRSLNSSLLSDRDYLLARLQQQFEFERLQGSQT